MKARDLMGAAVGAAAVWLAWQVVAQPIAERAPPALALRVAPASASVLARAADVELKAGRTANAADLSEAALRTAPFTLRALRVRAEAYQRRADLARADEAMTLAGNWSLRDTESHVWLMERRLRRGDYASAFAHAETLLRRRAEIADRVIAFFQAAYVHDVRSRGPILALLAKKPAWRARVVGGLATNSEGLGVLLSMVGPLDRLEAPFTDAELTDIYNRARAQESPAAVKAFQAATGRPRIENGLVDGGFTGQGGLGPLDWVLNPQGGSVVVIEGEGAEAHLLVEFDGHAAAPLAEQLLLLGPGPYVFGYENPDGPSRLPLSWTITCFQGGVILLDTSQAGLFSSDRAAPSRFTVPAGCDAQWLRLKTPAAGRSQAGTARYDNLTLRPGA